MALRNGTNTIKLQVIDDSDGKVKAEVSWFDLQPEVTLLLEKALIDKSIELGQAAIKIV